MECPDRCPGCDWRVPRVPRGMSDGLALSALLDHQIYDCPGGPQKQTAGKAPTPTVDAAVSP